MVFTVMAKKHGSSFNLASTLGMYDTNSYKMTILLVTAMVKKHASSSS